MHCVAWTYAVPPQLTDGEIRDLYEQVAPRYLGVPGLIRKYFGLAEDARTVIGIYLWTSREAADAFYSPEWVEDVTGRWGATPERADWVVPVVAESVTGEIVTDQTVATPATA